MRYLINMLFARSHVVPLWKEWMEVTDSTVVC